MVASNPITSVTGSLVFHQNSQNGGQKIVHSSQRNGSLGHLSPLPQFTNASSPHTPTSSGPGGSGVILENRRASHGGGRESRRPSGGGAGSRRPSGALSRRASGGGPFSPSCSSATTSPSEYTPSEVGVSFFSLQWCNISLFCTQKMMEFEIAKYLNFCKICVYCTQCTRWSKLYYLSLIVIGRLVSMRYIIIHIFCSIKQIFSFFYLLNLIKVKHQFFYSKKNNDFIKFIW